MDAAPHMCGFGAARLMKPDIQVWCCLWTTRIVSSPVVAGVRLNAGCFGPVLYVCERLRAGRLRYINNKGALSICFARGGTVVMLRQGGTAVGRLCGGGAAG